MPAVTVRAGHLCSHAFPTRLMAVQQPSSTHPAGAASGGHHQATGASHSPGWFTCCVHGWNLILSRQLALAVPAPHTCLTPPPGFPTLRYLHHIDVRLPHTRDQAAARTHGTSHSTGAPSQEARSSTALLRGAAPLPPAAGERTPSPCGRLGSPALPASLRRSHHRRRGQCRGPVGEASALHAGTLAEWQLQAGPSSTVMGPCRTGAVSTQLLAPGCARPGPGCRSHPGREPAGG